MNWNWPRDVDYIPASDPSGSGKDNIPFPTVMTLTINLVESFSTEQFNNFDLQAYRMGRFEDAFGGGSAIAKNATSDQQKDFGDTKSAGGVAVPLPGMVQSGAYNLVKEEAQTIAGAGILNNLGSSFNDVLQKTPDKVIAERLIADSSYVTQSVNTFVSGGGGDFVGAGTTVSY